MAQQHINYGTTADGRDGDTLKIALQKMESNDSELYRYIQFLASPRNLLLNGDCRINQRVFAGGNLAANTYGYDRWRAFGAAALMTATASTISLSGTFGQVIEAPNVAGATVTVSVTNPSGPIAVSLQPSATTAGVSGVIPAGAGLQSATLVVPASLTGTVWLLLTPTGTVTIDGPAKRGGIQLELGSIATPFEQRPIGMELVFCQRYYEKSFDQAVQPGTGQPNQHIMTGIGWSGTDARVGDIPFKVTKRAAPAIALYSDSSSAAQGSGWSLFNGSQYTLASQTLLVGGGVNSFAANIHFSSGLAFGQVYIVTGHWTADAEIY